METYFQPRDVDLTAVTRDPLPLAPCRRPPPPPPPPGRKTASPVINSLIRPRLVRVSFAENSDQLIGPTGHTCTAFALHARFPTSSPTSMISADFPQAARFPRSRNRRDGDASVATTRPEDEATGRTSLPVRLISRLEGDKGSPFRRLGGGGEEGRNKGQGEGGG